MTSRLNRENPEVGKTCYAGRLKIGSRVRCVDDRVEGRIVWANSVSVKIRWADGEQVTWRRDSLAGRPIEILQPADDEEHAVTSPETTDASQSDSIKVAREEQAPTAHAPEADTVPPEQPTDDAATPAVELATAERVTTSPMQNEGQLDQVASEATAPTPVPSKRQRNTCAAPKEKRISALDAAARVLAESGQPMNCQEMIAAMSEKGYWTSPGGKTPQATLHSAIIRELATKGTNSRFQKADRGKFSRTNAT